MLQVSHHEKSVWHALIALGTLHENFEKDQADVSSDFQFLRNSHDTFAIQEYVAAIRALLSSSNSPSHTSPPYAANTSSGSNLTVDVCLISCMLFVCYEVGDGILILHLKETLADCQQILSCHHVSATNHVRSGIKILNEVYYDASSGTYRHPYLKASTVSSLEMENLRKILIRLQGQTLTLVRASIIW